MSLNCGLEVHIYSWERSKRKSDEKKNVASDRKADRSAEAGGKKNRVDEIKFAKTKTRFKKIAEYYDGVK